MSFKQRLTVFIINSAMSVSVIISAVFLMCGWGVFTQTVIYALASVFLIAGVVFFILKKDALLKSAVVFLGCLAVVYIALVITNIVAGLDKIKSDEKKLDRLVALIRDTGAWGMAVFVVLQISQVLILPLPAIICYVSGVRIWGAWTAFGLACLGVFVGSVLCFVIGRFFGKKAAYWIAGKETVDKYADIMGAKGKVPFVMMQILPFFPDDILCIIAGLSSMSFVFFASVMLTVRPAVIAVYCFLGSGSIIPFHGWGVPVWIAIIALCAVCAALLIKYQSRIEQFIKRKFSRRKSVDNAVETDTGVVEEETADGDGKENAAGEVKENATEKSGGERTE